VNDDLDTRLNSLGSFAVPDPPSLEALDRRLPRLAIAAVGVVVLVSAGIAAVSLSRRDASVDVTSGGSSISVTAAPSSQWIAGPCAAPQPKPAAMSPEMAAEQAELKRSAEAEWATGWRRVRLQDMKGTWTCGWSHTVNATNTNKPGDKTPPPDVLLGTVFAAPSDDGQILGYAALYVGFVPRAEAEAPGFDATALRVAKNGCDPFADTTCKPVA